MRIGAVVPTLGASDRLAAAVAAIERQPLETEIVVVWQGPGALDRSIRGSVDRLIEAEQRLGFAAAVNRGLEAVDSELVAVVNDDAVVGANWLTDLTERLGDDPTLAAVQGMNLSGDGSPRIDGAGLAWNRWWQAVQIGRGRDVERLGGLEREVYGVSATAALYRRAALDAVSTGSGPFDERLDTYYEDVELAGRLRAAGHGAAVSPAATVDHQGGASASALGRRRLALLYGNRILVVGRLLGRAFWPRLPWIVLRDKLDAVARPSRLAGIAAGWSRALRRLSSFAHLGAPLVPLSELARFRKER